MPTLSFIGTFNTIFNLSELKLPIVSSAFPSSSPVGLAETKLTKPWTAFLPDNVPCGPFKTSILSRSWNPTSVNADAYTEWPLNDVTKDATTAAPTP